MKCIPAYFLAISLLLLAVPAPGQENKPAPPPFSPAVRANGLIFVSGHIGAVPATGDLAEGISAQTRQALENIRKVLEGNRAGLQNVVKTTVFLAHIEDFAAMNAEYAKFFPGLKPARSTVAVAGLVKGALIEIEAIAVDPSPGGVIPAVGGQK